MNFRERKAWRTRYYFLFVYKWKERACTACNGSGKYDNDGSPNCSSCNGTGREKYKSTCMCELKNSSCSLCKEWEMKHGTI